MTSQDNSSDFQTPLPSVRVDVIAHDPETIDALDKLSRDPLAARQKWSIVQGGLSEALSRYKAHPSPDLIIFQSDDEREKLREQITTLSQACGSRTRAIVIGRENDVDVFRMLQKSGVSDYLTRPFGQHEVTDAIRAIFSDKGTLRAGRISVFLGLSGGCGSSSMSQNVAVALSTITTNAVILSDFDLQGGTVKLHFDHQGPSGMNELIRQAGRVDATLVERLAYRRSDTLLLLPCDPEPGCDQDLPESLVDHLCGLAMHSAYHLVLDLPRHLTPQIQDIIRLADDIVLTVSPDLVGLRNFRLMLDHLSRLRPQEDPPLVILNKKGVKGRNEVPVSEFSDAVGDTRLVVFPFDARSFSHAIAKGRPLFEVSKKRRHERILRGLAKQLTDHGIPAVSDSFGSTLLRELKKWW